LIADLAIFSAMPHAGLAERSTPEEVTTPCTPTWHRSSSCWSSCWA